MSRRTKQWATVAALLGALGGGFAASGNDGDFLSSMLSIFTSTFVEAGSPVERRE